MELEYRWELRLCSEKKTTSQAVTNQTVWHLIGTDNIIFTSAYFSPLWALGIDENLNGKRNFWCQAIILHKYSYSLFRLFNAIDSVRFNTIPFRISKVSSSFCQLAFTVINTRAPSASLFDCLLLYVKCKCQSNFLQAYLHDNKLETNRWQLAEITGEHLSLISRFRRDMKGGPCAQPRLFSRAHTVTRGGNGFNFDHEKCQTEVIKEFTIQFAYNRITAEAYCLYR